MDRMGPDQAYWIRKLPDGTNITVSSLGGIKQVWIDTIADKYQFKACNLQGFLTNIDTYGNAYVPRDNYSITISNNIIDDAVGGKSSTIQYSNILTWDHEPFRYCITNASSRHPAISRNIYYRGCLYAKAPDNVYGAWFFDEFIICIAGWDGGSNGYIWYAPATTGGYGEDTPPWVLLQTYFCYGSNPDVKAFPNKDGNEIYLTKHDPFLGTGIWTGHMKLGMTSTHPYIISLDYSTTEGTVPTSINLGGSVMIPFDSGTITDRDELKLDEYEVNLKQYYYYIDGTINTEYPGDPPDYDAYARLTAVSDVTGPVEFSGDEDDLPDPPSGVIRWYYYTPEEGDYYIGIEDNDPEDIFHCANGGISAYHRDYGSRGGYSSYASGGYGTVDFDFNLDNELVELEFASRYEQGTSDDIYNNIWGHDTSTKQYGKFDAQGPTRAAVISVLKPAIKIDLDPPGVYKPPFSEGIAGAGIPGYSSLSAVGGYNPFTIRTRDTEGYDYVTRTTTGTQTRNYNSRIAGETYPLLTTYSNTTTYQHSSWDYRSEVDPTYEVIQYNLDNYDNWTDALYSSLCGGVDSDLVWEDVQGPNTSSVVQKTGFARAFIDYDLRVGIALMVKTDVTWQENKYVGTTKLYWKVNGDEDIDIITVDGILINPFTQYGLYGSTSSWKYLIYPYALESGGSSTWTGFSLTRSDIVPNQDGTVLYCKGTLFGESFELMASVQIAAGDTIREIILDDELGINSIVAL
ncbi:MAG: hypothetical protein H6961_07140 [Chromatiaceae bacterium]|nr:hypothetical protein [Chromatiaceae bacterium]